MHQTCALPKLASLLGRDSDGFRYGIPVESVKDVGLNGELKTENSSVDAFSDTVNIERPGSSEESVLLQSEICCGEIHDVYSKDAPIVVHDMPIVGTSSLENQVGPLVADARWNSLAESLQDTVVGVHGCASVKRERSQQELEEARDEKRVKVEGNSGLPCSFVNGNGLAPTIPHSGVEDCQGANPGVKERDDLRPLVQGTGISVSAPKDTDLTDLLNDLDDAGDSDLEDDEFGDDSHLWPEGLCDEWLGIGTISGNEVLAHMPEAEIIAKALNVSAEKMLRDGVKGTMLQAHSPEVEPSTEALASSSEQAQSNGDVRSLVPAHSPEVEPSTEALASSSEQAQSNGDVRSLVPAHSLQPETVTEALGFSSEQAQRDGETEIVVQAHEERPIHIVILDSDSDDDDDDGFMMFDHPVETSQVKNTVKVEPGAGKLEKSISQLNDVVKIEPESVRQPEREPERSHLMGNAVKVEPEIVGQPERSHLMGNAVKVEPEIVRQPKRSHQLENTVKEEPEILRQPEKSSQLRNAVKVETENSRQPEKSSEFVPNEISEMVPNEISELVPNETSELVPNEISELVPRESSHLASVVNSELDNMRQAADSRGSHGFEAPTMQGMHRPGQELRGFVLQTIEQDGKLMWALIPQNPDTTLGSPYSVNHMDPTPPQVNGLPNRPPNGLPYGLPFGLGCSSGPRSVRESFSSFGEQAGPSRGWIPPTTSADVPSYRGHAQPSGMGIGNHAIVDQAVVSVPRPSLLAGDVQDAAASRDQAWPSHDWTPPDSSAVKPSRDQAGPSHDWTPPDSSAVVPSRDQAGPSHGWTPPDSSAVVPYRYDSTVSTPRVNVTRVLQQYLICINKAKDAISARALAERESPSDEPVREGNRRGLDCRPDIVAYNDIKRANAGVNPGVNVGDLPGVQVGDTFTYRHQMAIVGLHRLPNVGIDYGRPPPDMIPTATAIVMMPKAGYVDDKDWGDTLLYTGQGGRKKRNQLAPFVQDQILTKGNLALAKNFERKLPVRVIRGHFGSGRNGPGVLGYSYDGLYSISKYELGDGINGFKVYKFFMERLEDQPPIPPCIAGCTAHTWNTSRKAPADVVPLQAKDPTVDVKPICMQDPPVDVKPIFMQEPLVEMKQICI